MRRLAILKARLDEAEGLALAIHLEIAAKVLVTLNDIRPATYLGKGKVEEFAALIKENDIAIVSMDCQLSPVQQRNLERAWDVKVIDRTGLILEIFGERARTREGSLQVELAHLAYQKSRLVRSWTHLERQRGGFGFLRRPRRDPNRDGSPANCRTDAKNRARSREGKANARLFIARPAENVPYPVIALVGYTNAGKSTLFNRLTQADVLAQDMLFATLDPTLRQVKLTHGGKALLSDTVGFISDLPTMLISAFRATLEEVTLADVILHVRDVSHEDSERSSA